MKAPNPARNLIDISRLVKIDRSQAIQEVQLENANFQGSPDLIQAKLVQQYGFASKPVPGCSVITINPGGNRSSALAIATNDARYNPVLQDGETRLHNNLSAYVSLVGNTVVINAPDGVTINGNLKVNGKIEATGDIIANGVSLINHVHNGVQPGGANTGVPVK